MKKNIPIRFLLFLALMVCFTGSLHAQVITPAGTTNICAGSSQVLSVVFGGAGETYQWQLNGTPIVAETNATYIATSVGVYTCAVTVNGITTNSNTATIAIKPLPTAFVGITTGTATFCTGSSATLSATTGTGYTYQWQKNGANISNITPTYTANTTGSYRCIVTDNGCIDTSNVVNITVNTPPIAAIAAAGGVVSVCAGNVLTLNATTTGTGLTYQWQLNGADVAGQVAANFSANTTGNYRCVMAQNGCVDTSNVLIVTIKPNPTANITPNTNQTICVGSSVLLTASLGTGYTYQWKLNGTNIPSATNSSYTANAAGNYICEVTNNGCTTSSSPVVVAVNALPAANIFPTNTTFCTGGSAVLSANVGTGLSYQWQLNGGVISGANAVTYTATSSGNYTCIVTQNSCSNTSNTSVVTANVPPIASITPTGPTTLCTGGSVIINANTGTGLTYQWQLNGTNITTSGTGASYTAIAAGTYTCIITQNGCPNTSNTVLVVINPTPTASISTTSSTTICAGTSVNISANVGTGLSYQWQLNGSNIPSATAPIYAANAAGNYTCIVTQSGCSATSNSINIIVTPLPTAIITPSGATSICVGNTVLLSANTSAGYTYQWQLNGSNITTGGTAATYNATITGSYTCIITQNSCAATSNTVNVSVNTPPVASISASGPTTFAAGGSVVLSANSGAGFSYQWLLNGVNIIGANAVTYAATSTGNYQCKVTQNGCDDLSSPITVTVTSTTSSITASGPTTLCVGNTLTLTASAGTNYQWQQGGVNISSETNQTYTTGAAGNYTCLITNGITVVSNVINITVNPNPTAAILPTATQTICAGAIVNFSANAGASYTYQWQLNGLNISAATNINYSATAAGNYRCVVSLNGCSTNAPATTVVVNPTPAAAITPLSNPICTGNTATLSATPTGAGYTYQWKRNGTNIAGATNATYTTGIAGGYECVVTLGSCSGTSPAAAVVVSAPPVASISAGGATTFFSNTNVVLNANTGAGFFYQWTQGGVAIPGATSASYTATATGSYQCIITQNGCSNTSAAIGVTVVPVSSVSISNAGPTTFCSGDSVVLGATPGTSYTYQWRLNGTNIPGASATNINYTATTSGSYTCRVSLSGSSVVSNAIAVTVNPSPAASITTASPASICMGDVALLNANTGTGYTYQWFRNGVAITTAINATYNAITTGNYTCAVTLGSCSKISNTINITINTPPVANVAPSGTITVCAGNNTTLTATTGTGFSYLWLRNGTPITPSATNSTYTASLAGNYTCIVAKNGCSDTSAVTNVIVNPLPTATISPSGPTTFCVGNRVVLRAFLGLGYTYQWRNAGTNIAGQTTDSLVVTTTGSYTCVVTANSCQNISNTINTIANPVPNATIAAGGPTTFFAGGNVQLTANAGTGYTYQWLQNNNIIPSANSINYTATTTGNYSCTVTQNGCFTTSNIVSINVLSASLTNISANGSTTICSGNTVELSAANNATYSYQWQKDGINISGANSYNYFANASGGYTCLITIAGSSAMSNNIPVTVNSAPAAVVAPPGPITLCAGSTAILNANTGTGFSYQWQNNAINISGATASTLTVGSTGNYRCIITQNGCLTTSAQASVTVNPLPAANITPASATTFFTGGSVVLNGVLISGATYQWYKDGVLISGAIGSNYTATTSGNYSYIVTRLGCSAQASVVTVTVTPTSGVAVTAQTTTTFCQGGSVILEATNGAGYTYQWTRNGVAISGATNSTYSATTNGNYTCVVSYLGSSTVPAAIAVNVTPLPSAGIAPSSATFCQGSSATLNATPTGTGIGYQWQRNGTTIAGATNSSYVAIVGGNYTCVVTQNGCSNTSVPSSVVVNAIPTASISTSYATTFFSGDSAVLNAAPSMGYTYQWQRNGVTISGAVNQNYTAYLAGTYTCIITQNGCANTSNNIIINVQPAGSVTISAVGSTTVCSGQKVELLAPSGAGYTYQWKRNGNNIAGANSISYLATTAANYSCTVTLGTSVITSNAITVNINPLPSVTATPATSINFCAGNQVTINATPINAAYSYQWQKDGANISTGTSIIASISGNYSCIATQNGCIDTSNNVSVNVRALPNAVVTPGGPTTFFAGGNVTLVAAAGTGYTYQWYKDGVLIVGANNISLVANATGNYTCVHTLNGCDATSLAISVAVLPTSLASITNNGSTNFCTGGTVELQAATTTANAYQWQLNGVAIAGATNFNYTAAVSGSYSCLITISGTTTTSNAINVTVNAPPTATVVPGSSTTFFAGGSVTLIANVGTFTYQWLLNGAQIGGASSFNYGANASGNYSCVVSSSGCTDTSAAIAVNVVPVSATQISAQSSVNVCAGNKVELKAAGNGLSYQWKQNGAVLLGETARSYFAITTGTYSCDVTVGTSTITSNTINVTVNAVPVATISTAGSSVICSGASLMITANNSAGYTYQWLYNNGIISGANGVNYSANSAGNYSCIVAQNGCADTSVVIAATVAPRPAATVGSDQNLCVGDVVVVGAPSVAGNTYTWASIPAGFVANTSQITINPNTTTTYTLTEQITATGCSKTDTLVVSVVARAQANLTAVDTLVAVGDTAKFVNNTINTPFCIWNYGDGRIDTLATGINPRHIYNAVGYYTIKITTFGTSCPDTARIFVRVNNDVPTPEFAMTVFPNPSRGIFSLKLDLESKDDVIIGVFDDRGRLVNSMFLPQLPEGITDIPIEIVGQAQGPYTLSVTVGKENINKQKFNNGLPSGTRLKYQKFAKAVIQL
jgi:hypothetical protein